VWTVLGAAIVGLLGIFSFRERGNGGDPTRPVDDTTPPGERVEP
jgi:hypothetical protein